MEEGTKAKKTIFIGGLTEQVDETAIYETFQTFGDILEVQLPQAPETHRDAKPKHRGFAFVTYSSPADAQDAIENMDMNELNGRVLKVNLARPSRTLAQPSFYHFFHSVWENEDWLKAHVKPLAQSGGAGREERADKEEDQDEAADEPMDQA
jgi:peptidyl-prolyl isomerase E (cyclophilin E)